MLDKPGGVTQTNGLRQTGGVSRDGLQEIASMVRGELGAMAPFSDGVPGRTEGASPDSRLAKV